MSSVVICCLSLALHKQICFLRYPQAICKLRRKPLDELISLCVESLCHLTAFNPTKLATGGLILPLLLPKTTGRLRLLKSSPFTETTCEIILQSSGKHHVAESVPQDTTYKLCKEPWKLLCAVFHVSILCKRSTLKNRWCNRKDQDK